MLKIGIYGASGYTGQELLRLLLRHPEAEVVALTSRRFKGLPISDVYSIFVGLTDLVFTDASPEDVASVADVVFLALPHGVSMKVVPIFLPFAVPTTVILVSSPIRERKESSLYLR